MSDYVTMADMLELEQWYPLSVISRSTDIYKQYRGCLIAINKRDDGYNGYYGEWFRHWTTYWIASSIIDTSLQAAFARAKRMIDLQIVQQAMEKVIGRKLTWEEKAGICREKTCEK